MAKPETDQHWMPDEATCRAFAEAVAAFGERVDGLTPVSQDERVKPRWRHDDGQDMTPPVVEAMVATQRMVLDEAASPELLAPVLWCACARQSRISHTAPYLLALLAEHFLIARQAQVWLFGRRQMDARLSAVDALRGTLPHEMTRWMLERALADKSNRVRRWAAARVSSCEMRSVLPALLRAAKAEKEEKWRKWMTTMYHTCDLGYHFVNDPGDDLVELVMRTVDDISTGLSHTWHSREDFERHGPMAIVEAESKEPEPYPMGLNPLPEAPSTPTPPWQRPVGRRPFVYSWLLRLEGPYLVDVLKERH